MFVHTTTVYVRGLNLRKATVCAENSKCQYPCTHFNLTRVEIYRLIFPMQEVKPCSVLPKAAVVIKRLNSALVFATNAVAILELLNSLWMGSVKATRKGVCWVRRFSDLPQKLKRNTYRYMRTLWGFKFNLFIPYYALHVFLTNASMCISNHTEYPATESLEWKCSNCQNLNGAMIHFVI